MLYLGIWKTNKSNFNKQVVNNTENISNDIENINTMENIMNSVVSNF